VSEKFFPRVSDRVSSIHLDRNRHVYEWLTGLQSEEYAAAVGGEARVGVQFTRKATEPI